jgi:type I restriction enzyme M protein
LTCLLFLKMADEQTKPPFNKPSRIPKKYDWQTLLTKDGDELEVHYRRLLEELGKEKGILGVIFRKSRNKIQDPAKLRRLIEFINGETWVGLDIDVKGDIYEGLLQKNAEDTKSGAGQYFTPRPLTKAMVAVTRPEPGMRVGDPCSGTAGFFLAHHNYLTTTFNLDKAQKKFLRLDTYKGWEIVDATARLAVMNLYLPEPDVLASEIVENLGTALEMFEGAEEKLEVQDCAMGSTKKRATNEQPNTGEGSLRAPRHHSLRTWMVHALSVRSPGI